VSATGIGNFLDAVAQSKHEMHSFMLLRHGKVVAEGWWDPYKPALKHTMYSCSKSFTATAVGFAVAENKLKLTDKVISFFPEYLPQQQSENLRSLTVRDVLIMADGQVPDPTFRIASNDTNWVKAFLATDIKEKPGSVFLYNSMGTYMLSAIVQQVTGQKLMDYLKPRLFEPLGIEGIDWEEDLRGINTGGWGLRLKTEDMAKFAQLFLQQGKWNGKQILPAAWVQEASAKQILQQPEASPSKRDSSDWLQGYGYQMWRCRNNAFRGDGAYGQYMIVMPEQDAVMAITSETPDLQGVLDLVWKHILPALKQGQDKDPSTAQVLQQKLGKLSLPAPATSTGLHPDIRHQQFKASSNSFGIRSITLDFKGQVCKMTMETDTATFTIDFAEGKWLAGITSKPMPSLFASAKEKLGFLYPAKTQAAFAWTDNQTLECKLRYVESPHAETFEFHLTSKPFLEIKRSLDFGKTAATIALN
jgi:CubicO group peptidase (beta-lactamase class C family)